MGAEHGSRSVIRSRVASVWVGLVALAGCNFNPNSHGGGGGPALGEESGTTVADSAATEAGADGVMTGGGTTGETPPTSGPSGDTTLGDGADETSTGEPQPCMGPGDCPPETPFCAEDGVCYDGTKADPCMEGECQAPLVCGPHGQCQDGAEGDPCLDPSDCSAGASICAVDGQCHDGGEDDPCGSPADCSSGTPICSSYGDCQDGNEGDECDGPSDCGPSAPHCPWDGMCHDGTGADACDDSSQCNHQCVLGFCTFF